MDCNNDEGRQLPMSWMRRTERVDFMDLCASSPPADGFFYATHSQTKNRTITSEDSQGNISTTNSQIQCNNSEQRGFFKSFGPGNYPSSHPGPEVSGRVLNMDSQELETWAKTNIRGNTEISTAPTEIDHVPQFQQKIVPTITKTEDGSSLSRFVASTPEVTPCTTPSVTPCASPHIPRKAGNPFVTGEPSGTADTKGSWLFRPGAKTENMLYEAKLEIQHATGSQAGGTKTKLVPRPSKLRELNFFSPTSM